MLTLRSGVEIVDGEDGKFLLDVNKGIYWHLNSSAIELLESLRSGRSFDEFVTTTAQAAQVDEARVRTDFTALVRELRKAKLVEGQT